MVSTKQNKSAKLQVLASTYFWSDTKSIYTNLVSITLLIACYLLFFNKAEMVFFSAPNKSPITFFTDKIDNGNSTLDKTWQGDSAVGIKCTLKKGFLFPYSGFEIPSQDHQKLDISAYNRIQVDLSVQNIEHLYIYLVLKDSRVRDTLNRVSLRRMLKDVSVHNAKQTLNVDIEDFITPDWWYDMVNQPKTDFADPEWDKLQGMIFSTGINPKLNEPCTFSVKRIIFHRDNSLVFAVLFGIQGLVTLASFVFYRYKKNQLGIPQITIDINYKAINTKENALGKCEHDFLDFIHENFTDSELSLKQVSKASGINEKIISQTIAEKFNCNFKTYINQIRIIESKRLLLESDLNIGEIAYKTGFNSPANFNRVFKTFLNITPTEFIQLHKNNSHSLS
jgi:AraC-like DNA-binding protein